MKTITLDGNHWFALKVFYNKVFEIEESLKKDDIDCYFPCEDAVVMRNGVRKIIRKPIISSILFFHSTTLRAMEIQRQFTDKVILYTRDKELKKVPLIIPDREMNIFMLVTSSGEKGMEYLGADSTKFCRGERVRVIDGKFKGAEGYICRIKKKQPFGCRHSGGLCRSDLLYPTKLYSKNMRTIIETGLFLSGGFLISILQGLILIPNILLISYKKRLFDQPDERKVHSIPVPRLGGISFFPAILVSLCLIIGLFHCVGIPIARLLTDRSLLELLFWVSGCMLLYLIGVADDLVGVGYRYKFVVQVFTAILLVLPGAWINSLGGLFGIYMLPSWVGIPLTVLIVVYITNAINLIDGIDGLASGLSCIALTVLAAICISNGSYFYALLALATLGILIPFWFYNVFGNAQRGHKLFMGDTGSLTIGYILSFLVIQLSVVHSDGEVRTNPYMVIAFSTLLVPLLDVFRVVLHRLRKGRNPFLPDKNHIHHKLLRTGMRVRTVLVTVLLISFFFIGMNILLSPVLNLTWLLVLNMLLWALIHLIINRCIILYQEKEWHQ